jgi:phosphatidylserine/phosphatidylglycerophosphate/cardiolipin synthase-like enzyme
LLDAFKQAWDGNFRDVILDQTKPLNGDAFLCLKGGSRGQAVDMAVKAIEAARESIHFAYFNLSNSSRVAEALVAASKRGVRIAGVVDGDQQAVSWDAVPLLRSSGVDARYYPGALTGAIGRMHYKMMVVDQNTAHLATANASQAAETSFELGLTAHGNDLVGDPANYIEKEIERLIGNALIPEDNDG